jgi:dipeptidyl aminopeptidase/acylaminoacyl peptidase
LLAAVALAGVLAIPVLHAAATGQPAQDPAARASTEKRPITDRDLFDFTWVADPQVSPDGSRVAFTRVVVDAKRAGYETSIWVVGSAGDTPSVRLTSGKHDSHARWSPDGRRLVFVRAPEKSGSDDGTADAPQLAVLSLAGGEAWTITNLPKGAANPEWSPDSARLAFLSSTTADDLRKQAEKNARSGAAGAAPPGGGTETPATAGEVRKPSPETEHKSDVHVITRAVYRSNDW